MNITAEKYKQLLDKAGFCRIMNHMIKMTGADPDDPKIKEIIEKYKNKFAEAIIQEIPEITQDMIDRLLVIYNDPAIELLKKNTHKIGEILMRTASELTDF